MGTHTGYSEYSQCVLCRRRARWRRWRTRSRPGTPRSSGPKRTSFHACAWRSTRRSNTTRWVGARKGTSAGNLVRETFVRNFHAHGARRDEAARPRAAHTATGRPHGRAKRSPKGTLLCVFVSEESRGCAARSALEMSLSANTPARAAGHGIPYGTHYRYPPLTAGGAEGAEAQRGAAAARPARRRRPEEEGGAQGRASAPIVRAVRMALRAVVSCAAWCAWKKDAESHSAPHRPLALRSEP